MATTLYAKLGDDHAPNSIAYAMYIYMYSDGDPHSLARHYQNFRQITKPWSHLQMEVF